MNSVIIFDVSDNQVNTVRELLKSYGYFFNWFANEDPEKKTVYLPHNIVWKPNTESQQALDDIKRAIATININRAGSPVSLLRCVVLNSTPWKAINGEVVK